MKTSEHTPSHRRRPRARGVAAGALSLALAVSGLAVASVPALAVAPFPVADIFSGPAGAVNPQWRTISNDGAAGRYTTDGWTRLTSAEKYRGTNMVNETAFPSSTGFQLEFDYRMAGGAPLAGTFGDGISVYLIDGAQGATEGGEGGGLAYANGGANGGDGCGVSGGYFGIGLDVYGNFSNGAETNTGGPGRTKSMVGLRGSGEPCDETARYPWVGGSVVSGLQTSSVGDPATSASSTFRRVRVRVEPQGDALQVTVAMTAAVAASAAPGAFSPVMSADLSRVEGQAPLPVSLKLGFGASTGGATNYMDVRNIDVRAFTDVQVTQRISAATPGHAGLPEGSFVPGDPISFEAIATNNGPTTIGAAPDGVAVLYDDLSDLPLENVSWTCSPTGGATCETGGGSGPVVSEEWSGPAGSSVTVAIHATVSTTVSAGHHTNSAVLPTDFGSMTVNPLLDTIQRDGGASDTDLSNNTATVDFDIVLISDAESSLIAAQPPVITTDGDSSVTVTLLDVNGNQLTVGGADVTMSTDLGTLGAVTDNGNGTYTALLSGAGPTGTATIGFRLDGIPGTATATVTIAEGVASPITSTIAASSSRILNDGSSTITVTTFDASGNRLTAGGAAVTMTTDRGVLDAIVDNGDGTYSTTLTGSGEAGTATVGFAIDEVESSATSTVEILAASIGGSTISASHESIVADGVSTSEITVTVRDTLGEPAGVGGQDVVIELLPGIPAASGSETRQFLPAVAPASDNAPTLSATTDNGDGTYTAILTSPVQTGNAILGFTVESVPSLSTALVTFTPQLALVAPADPAPSAPAVHTGLASTGASAEPMIPLLAAVLVLAGLVLALGAPALRGANRRHAKI